MPDLKLRRLHVFHNTPVLTLSGNYSDFDACDANAYIPQIFISVSKNQNWNCECIFSINKLTLSISFSANWPETAGSADVCFTIAAE